MSYLGLNFVSRLQNRYALFSMKTGMMIVYDTARISKVHVSRHMVKHLLLENPFQKGCDLSRPAMGCCLQILALNIPPETNPLVASLAASWRQIKGPAPSIMSDVAIVRLHRHRSCARAPSSSKLVSLHTGNFRKRHDRNGS